MKKRTQYFLLIVLLPMLYLHCAEDTTKERQILAKVNDYDLTLKEFEEQLVEELEMDEEFKLTLEAKKEILEQMIREEILIQEAVRLKLDRKEKFIKAIERYWKATLIRDLMESKSESFGKTTYVTEEEAIDRYKEMQGEMNEILPFDELKDSIVRELKEKKKRKRLVAWMDDLRKATAVTINEDLLNKK